MTAPIWSPLPLLEMVEMSGEKKDGLQNYKHRLIFLSSDMRSVLCKHDVSGLVKALKARHTSVIETTGTSNEQKRRKELLRYVSNISDKRNGHVIRQGETGPHVIGFETSADVESVFEELGVSTVRTVKTELDVTVYKIPVDDVITAYLKQAASLIPTLQNRAGRIHSVIPYHYEGQIAVVVYTYHISPELCKKHWSEEFLEFPVFIVDLMSSCTVDPPIMPEPYPVIPQEDYPKYSKTKDEVTQELAKKHSNLSSICVHYRISKNKLEDDEICIQIGVLTKGIVPLGEELFPAEIKGIPVDIVESSAVLCVSSKPLRHRVEPVKLGIGIGVKASTGSLGGVVNREESGELKTFLLSNAHVLSGSIDADSSYSVNQPSQKDHKELMDDCDERETTLKDKCETAKRDIEQKSDSEDVKELMRQLRERERYLERAKEDTRNYVEDPKARMAYYENEEQMKKKKCEELRNTIENNSDSEVSKRSTMNLRICVKDLERIQEQKRQLAEEVQEGIMDYHQDVEKMREQNIEELKQKIEKSDSENVKEWMKTLRGYEMELVTVKEEREYLRKYQSPRIIGTFTSKDEHCVQDTRYHFLDKEYGIDAALAEIKSDEINAASICTMYEWPDDLEDETGGTVDEIKLNGTFMSNEDVKRALHKEIPVYKCGRTTGVTKGTLHLEENVRIPTNGDMWYNVLHIESKMAGDKCFIEDGDSGAVLFDKEGTCVGLLFGREDKPGSSLGTGLATPMYVVVDALKIELASPEDFTAQGPRPFRISEV